MKNQPSYIVLLFYKYIALPDPLQECKKQKDLCLALDLKGRILLAHEGINGTLSGTAEACEQYKKYMQENQLFCNIDFKESISPFIAFEKLHVKVKKEIVNFGPKSAFAPLSQTAEALNAEDLHALLETNPKNTILLDARNAYEAAIGAFENATIPPVRYFRDFPEYLEKNKDVFEGKDVIMYCTGGIRCERSSAFLKTLNVAKSVKKLEGGIHKYLEKYPNGFFKGRNYVFDDRISIKINETILSHCNHCSIPCDLYNNCLNALCNKHYLCCDSCLSTHHGTCSSLCYTLITNAQVPCRPPLVAREIYKTA